MGLNKKELDRIVSFVKKVKELPGNEEFIADLRATIIDADTADDIISNPKIDKIYEYCIKNVLQKQAEGVYAQFPIPELIPGLVNDYVRMESFRRADNFEDFCMALYQQIECVTNATYALLDDCSFLQDIADQPAYAQSINIDGVVTYDIRNRNSNSKSKISAFIAKKEKVSNTPKAMDATKMVIYFVVCGALRMDWELLNRLYEVYYCRCLNHRGGFQTENQANTTTKVCADKYTHYLLFQSALVTYISGIQKGFSDKVLDQIEAWSESLKGKTSNEDVVEVTIESILPSIFFCKSTETNKTYHSKPGVVCPEGKIIGDTIKVQVQKIKDKDVITKVMAD